MIQMLLLLIDEGKSKYCCDKEYTSKFSCRPRVKKTKNVFSPTWFDIIGHNRTILMFTNCGYFLIGIRFTILIRTSS